VVSLGELEYSKATSNPVRIVLAVVKDHVAERGDQLPDGVRVSTEFPQLTKRYFESIGVRATIVPSYGATEAKVPDIVEAIVDLTETGTSLRKHGLKIIDTLLTSRTEVITNAAAYADPEKRAAMDDVMLLLRGAVRARGNVLIKLNVADAQLPAVLAVLPSMGSPTVTALASGDMHAVESVVPKRGVNTLIPTLKAAGARDILEITISKIVD
jgi:ATP phosphoribosyltransferase